MSFSVILGILAAGQLLQNCQSRHSEVCDADGGTCYYMMDECDGIGMGQYGCGFFYRCCIYYAGKYGDINQVNTTGASSVTSRQDNLRYTGIAASERMAETDSQRMHSYHRQIYSIGRELIIDPAIIAGIISRESRAGNVLDRRGYGDHGNAFGLMQIDVRHHTPEGTYNSFTHIRQATEILIDMINKVSQKHPKWSKEMKLKGGIAAYNVGVSNVQTIENMDQGTTNNDYSNDVVARAKWYKAHVY